MQGQKVADIFASFGLDDKKLQQGLKSADKSLGKTSKEFKKTEKVAGTTEKTIKKTGVSFVDVSKKIKETGETTAGTNKNIFDMQKAFQKVGLILAGGVIAKGILNIGKASLRLAGS